MTHSASVIDKLRRKGLAGCLTAIKQRSGYFRWRFKDAPKYANPTPAELDSIERELGRLGVLVEDYAPSPDAFRRFQSTGWFPPDYHGGTAGAVWNEKLLEHWISSEILGLAGWTATDVYVDVAAASSPWAKALRERLGIAAYAIDMCGVGESFRCLPYYRVENATSTTFADASVRGASLQCAYEMFAGDDDKRFLSEVARILKPGGRVVILPLYTHTHYCAYASPEYYGKGRSDPDAKEYVRLDVVGIPSSRKYDPTQLKHWVLDRIVSLGMTYRLRALRSKSEFGAGVYCHFVLEITR